jgi:hypothetical protein
VGNGLEQLTDDHRVACFFGAKVPQPALGINPQIEIDYGCSRSKRAMSSYWQRMASTRMSARAPSPRRSGNANDLDAAARFVVEDAYRNGSADNLTVQIVRSTNCRTQMRARFMGSIRTAAAAAAGRENGIRRISNRPGSAWQQPQPHLSGGRYRDRRSGHRQDSVDRIAPRPAYLKRFMMEEWVARRISSAHVLKPCLQSRKRNYLYVVTEFIDGKPDPVDDRQSKAGSGDDPRIVEQIARGLQAFHRMEMLHQDIRPDNIMIDKTGTVKIIDFGSTKVKGVIEAAPSATRTPFWAPPSTRARIFPRERAARMLRHLLSRRHHLSDADRKAALRSGDREGQNEIKQQKLKYNSALDDSREIPAWIDAGAQEGRASGPIQALSGAVRVHL